MSNDLQQELSLAKQRLAMFLDAEDRIVRGGQVMTIDDGDMKRTVTRADAKWVSSRISFWRAEVSRLRKEISNEGGKSRRGIYVRLM